MKNRIAVIGAGVSGLTIARLLKDSADVTVFESDDRPGGLIKCDRVDGSLFHTCGGHVFNIKRHDVLNFSVKLREIHITGSISQMTNMKHIVSSVQAISLRQTMQLVK